MTSPILFAGQEDLSFNGINASITSNTASSVYTNTTTGVFRAGYARYAINVAQNVANGAYYIRNAAPFTATSFWTSARFWCNGVQSNPSFGWTWIRWLDASGIVRLKILTANTTNSSMGIYTVNAAGTSTQLGSNTASGISISPGVPDKIDVFINYAVAGQITLYINGTPLFNFTGDVTTDGITSLASVDFGMACASAASGLLQSNNWSEQIVATRDTRNMSLVTQAPLTTGNTAAWTEGTNSFSQSNTGVSPTTSAQAANTVVYSKFVATLNGQVNTLTNRINAGITATTQCAVYADSVGQPGALLGSSATVANPTSGDTTYTFTGGPNIIFGKTYWVAFWSNASYVENINQTTGTGFYNQTGQTGGFPSNAAGTVVNSVGNQIWTMNVTAPNVTAFNVNQASPDFSASANQVQQYQVAQPLPAGSFSVVSVVQHAQCTVGPDGPQHIEFNVRTGGSDFFTADMQPPLGWGLLAANWDTNPNTTVAWQTTELVSASTSFNLGFKSTA